MGKNKSKKNLAVLFLICSFAILLNNIALETGDTTQTGRVSKLHCPKKGRCFWMTDVVPAELSINVKASIADILAGILASLLLVIGEDAELPYGYLPWLFLSFKSLITMQGPSIIKFGYKALPMEKYSTIAFMIIATFLYEQIVLKVLRKWETKARLDDEKYYRMRDSAAPLPINEVVVSTEPDDENPICSNKAEAKCQSSGSKYESAADTYNGAERSGYLWSQTISDLDVQVTVPPFVTKAKQLQVDIESEKLCVKLHNVPEDYTTENPEKANAPLIEGDFCHKTKKGESTWTLIPGKEVQIHLEKCQERWWDALLTGEEKIDLLKIDASRPVEDLPQEEQMKIQELMWAEQKKRMLDPNGQDQPMSDLLKKAWNLEGSPFKGLEYNPSMINFAGSPDPY